MKIIDNKYYIIRTGDFATNANKKIIYSLLGLGLCALDYMENGTLEYSKLMIGSSILWTFVEYVLNNQQIRVIKPMSIVFNGNTYIVNKYIGICLQGIQEGGAVSIIGLYFGDRFFSFYYQICYHILILYMVTNMMTKKSNLKVLSKRQVNTPGSLFFMTTISLWNVMVVYYHPNHMYREFNMFLSMTYISGIWSIVSYYKQFRQVEVHIKQNDLYHTKNTTWKDGLFILGYDVFFEIGIAYITFYNLFVVFSIL